MENRLAPRDRVLALGAGALAFAVYAAGASPTIYVGDSGELAAAVHTLGIPHPSGYPLYVLAGKLWTLACPIGSVAYRLGLFSAAAAAAAVAITYGIVRSTGVGRLSCLVAALLLAFSPSLWGEANIPRVYALNALALVAAIRLMTVWLAGGSERTLTAAFFVCGLGAANHTFMALAVVALAVMVAVHERQAAAGPRGRGRRAARCLGAFALGLLPYLYLPLRSRAEPPLDWGDPETAEALWRVIVRADFWPRAWIESASDLAAILADWLASIGAEMTLVGAGLALLGAFHRRLPAALRLGLAAVMVLNVAALAAHGSRSDIFIWHRYYIPTYVAVAVFAGAGCDLVLRNVPRPVRYAALLLPLFLWTAHRAEFDRSRYRIAEDFAERILAALPPGAHLIASDDNILFALIYLHLAEGRRPDVHLVLQGVGKARLPTLSFDPEADPVFFTHHPNWSLDGLAIVPVGPVFRAWRAGSPPPAFSFDVRPLDGAEDPAVPQDYLTRNLVAHFHYMVGLTLLSIDWPRAATALTRAGEIAPENDVLLYNLGLVYLRSGLYPEAESAFARSEAVNPRRIAGDPSAHASDRLREVRAEHARITQVERELLETMEGVRPRQGTSAYHSALADSLAARGEARAALGRRLRAWASHEVAR